MKLFRCLLVLFWSTAIYSQIKHPKASPFATVSQDVGLSEISVSYSRPGAKGRVLFEEQANEFSPLVPNGRIWRMGANASTKITFTANVTICNKELRKGTYALYAFPGEKVWEIVFHKNLSHWGDGRTKYNPKEDALRVTVRPSKKVAFQENFLIAFDAITHNSVVMILSWGTLQLNLPIAVDTFSMMESQIQQALETAPTAQTYYEIARYYQEQGVYTKKALGYVNKAIRIKGDTYYFHRVKSLLLADLHQYGLAIKEAKLSMALANKEGKDEFVRLNENNILRWQKNNN